RSRRDRWWRGRVRFDTRGGQDDREVAVQRARARGGGPGERRQHPDGLDRAGEEPPAQRGDGIVGGGGRLHARGAGCAGGVSRASTWRVRESSSRARWPARAPRLWPWTTRNGRSDGAIASSRSDTSAISARADSVASVGRRRYTAADGAAE